MPKYKYSIDILFRFSFSQVRSVPMISNIFQATTISSSLHEILLKTTIIQRSTFEEESCSFSEYSLKFIHLRVVLRRLLSGLCSCQTTVPSFPLTHLGLHSNRAACYLNISESLPLSIFHLELRKTALRDDSGERGFLKDT